MNKRLIIILVGVSFLALVIALTGLFSPSENIKWAAPAYAIALVALGLGISSYIVAANTEKRVSHIDATLKQIKTLQEEIKKELTEQADKKGSSPQIIPILQAISKSMGFFSNGKE
jgi:hypothetical protein